MNSAENIKHDWFAYRSVNDAYRVLLMQTKCLGYVLLNKVKKQSCFMKWKERRTNRYFIVGQSEIIRTRDTTVS